uniref:Cytochrome b5 heme-binding domain-containing protein n=1 Tax=Pyrodinium bahamense TaxID=73915 RepID=A0A7R9ZZJ4_9DINO
MNCRDCPASAFSFLFWGRMESLASGYLRLIATVLLVVAGFLAVYGFHLCRASRRAGKAAPQSRQGQANQEPDRRKLKGCAKDYADKLPTDGVFTLETLARWDGVHLPMCIGMCGKVVDVSSSENFEPDMGYGKLWGGKDATYALAMCSLKPEDASVLDWDIEELGTDERQSLASWYTHFTGKYPIIGTLREYEHRDLSSVLPAPAGAGEAEVPERTPDEAPSQTAKARPKEAGVEPASDS